MVSNVSIVSLKKFPIAYPNAMSRLDEQQQCVDSNECAGPGPAPCSGPAHCINTPGSFRCQVSCDWWRRVT